MNGFFTILLILSMLGVVGILGAGFFSMAKGGEFNKKYGNRLMRWRVIMQGAALLFFALAVATRS